MATNKTVDRYSDSFLLDCYMGRGGYLTGRYLVPHKRESLDDLEERAAISVYPNYVRDVVDTYSGYLWKRQPARESGDGYAAFTLNADGAGHSLDYVLQTDQLIAMVLGSVWLIVDRAPVIPQTRAQQPAPYLAMRLPGQVARYKLDSNGQLESITFREVADGAETTPSFGLGMLQSLASLVGLGAMRYRTFTRTGWKISLDEAGYLVTAQGEHKLGRVPVVRLNSTVPLLPGQLRADPWAFGISQLNWSLYNLESEKRTLFRKQTFSILTIPIVDGDEAEKLKDLTLGTDNALTYNPTGGGKPGYIAPPADPIDQYQKEVDATITGIYKAANLEFIAGVHASAVAMSFQFQKANSSMGLVAAQCEAAEREIAQIVAAWEGEQTGTISYPRDFNLTDLSTDLQTALTATTLKISPTFEKELKKRTARQVLGHGVPAATMGIIDSEIDQATDPYGDRMQQQAGGA